MIFEDTLTNVKENIIHFGKSFLKEGPYTPAGPTGVFGYPANRTDVNNNYIITLHSSLMQRTIRALFQDNFTTSITSLWKESALGSAFQGNIQDLSQALTGLALGSQFMTRRIWYGSSPMNLSLRLRFEAIEDAYSEVVVPCITLQQMAAPSLMGGSYDDSIYQTKGFLGYIMIVPPGPNPFYGELREMAAQWVGKTFGETAADIVDTRKGDIITIEIGSLMMFQRVIVSRADVEWGRKFNKQGHPVSASADISFETFEICTKEDLENQIFSYSPVEYVSPDANRHLSNPNLKKYSPEALATVVKY